MNVVVVGKPRLDITMPLDKFLLEGTTNKILEKSEAPGGNSIYVACMLAKWGVHIYYSGVVGGDEIGNNIKKALDAFGVNTKYVEQNFEHKTEINYSIYNKENAQRTNIIHDNGILLSKYKFEFVPDLVICDSTDLDGALGISNTYPTANILFLANEVNNKVYDYTKRCKFVVCNEPFAEALSKMKFNYTKSKTLVDIFQKIKDLNKANYIMNLVNHGTLYVKDRQVKYIPKPEIIIKDYYMVESAFYAVYAYGLINNLDIDETAKLANMASNMAGEKIGSVLTIPEKSAVYNACGLTENVMQTPSVTNDEVVNNENQNEIVVNEVKDEPNV